MWWRPTCSPRSSDCLPTRGAELALELIRSLDSEYDDDAAAARDVEIERRAAEVEDCTAETMTLEEYRDRVRARRAARTRR